MEELFLLDLPNDILRYEVASRLDFETRNHFRSCNKELRNLIASTTLDQAVVERFAELEQELRDVKILVTEWFYEEGSGLNSRLCTLEYASQEQCIWPGRFVYWVCSPTDAETFRKFYANGTADLYLAQGLQMSYGYFELRHVDYGSDLQHVATVKIKNSATMMYVGGRCMDIIVFHGPHNHKTGMVEVMAHMRYFTKRISKFMDYVIPSHYVKVIFEE